MIRTEKNTKGRKAAETKTEERPIQAVLSRVDVIMPVGRSQLEGQAILRERVRGETRVPHQLPSGLTPLVGSRIFHSSLLLTARILFSIESKARKGQTTIAYVASQLEKLTTLHPTRSKDTCRLVVDHWEYRHRNWRVGQPEACDPPLFAYRRGFQIKIFKK